MNVARRDAWAMSLLSASAIGSAAVAFGVQTALARALDAESFGRFAAALAAINIIAPTVGFGLPSLWLQAFGTEGWSALRWMEPSISLIRRTALVSLSAALAWALLGTRDDATGRLIIWMLPVVLTQGAIELATAKLQIEEQFGFVAAWQAIQHLLRLAFVLVCWKIKVANDVFAMGFGCIGVFVSIGAWRSVAAVRAGKIALVGHGAKPAARDEHDPGYESVEQPGVAHVWKRAAPFGIATLLFFAYGQSGLIIVAHFTTPRDAGAYGVAMTLLQALYLLPSVLFQKLLMPRYHRWAATGDARLAMAFKTGNRWTIVSGVGVAIVASLVAPIAIPLVFGSQYTAAVHTVVLMTACVPLRFLAVSASSVMTAGRFVQVRNGCAAAALVVSVMAGCLLVPSWGLIGAAISAIAGEATWAVLSVACARRLLFGARASASFRDGGNRPAVAVKAAQTTDLAPLEFGGCRDSTGSAPVSAIIPCFNCSASILRAVESVFNQTWRPKELILVDDCSSDDTLQHLLQLSRRYPPGWVRVIGQSRNAGPGAARNSAWARATQPYLAFLDADDSWHPRKIEIQYGWMHAHPDAVITGHPVTQWKACDDPPGNTFNEAWHEPKQVPRWRVLFSNRFTPSSIIVRAEAKARFDEKKRHAEDYFMLLELVLVHRGHAWLFPMSLSYIYKAQFGARTGLSAQLWKIQCGEQDNYRHFRKSGAISYVEWMCFSGLSALKYLRRCLVSGRFA
jgi:glycosyltransferase involved in cell wall biosynthesis/O-antigen/teichoic acid export membrane protein